MAKSAGADEGARIKLTEKHLDWAYIIFVMENEQRQLIKRKFQTYFDRSKIVVLDTPDEYE